MSDPRKGIPPLPEPDGLRQRRRLIASASPESRRVTLRAMLASLCLLAVGLQAAACRTEPSPARPVSAESHPAPTVGIAPAEDVLPTQPVAVATPVATAALIRPAIWSPDNRWLAFRASTQSQVEAAAGETPEATWRLYDALAETICSLPDIGPDWQLAWEGPDMLLLSSSDGLRRSAPCAAPGPASPVPASEPATTAAISADGAFAAQTDTLSTKPGVVRRQTTITDLAQQRVVVQAEWSIDERIGALGLGGEWVGPSTFLLYETAERGPLLLETSGEVQAVLSDLLQIHEVPSITGPDAYAWVARPAIDPAGPSFHLLLSGVGEEVRFPMAVLYHSKDGSHETLPYQHPWRDGFTPDGRWVLMDARPDDEGYEAHQVWIRPTDARTADWVVFADRLDNDLWSADMNSYAWQRGSQVHWQTFPAGEALGRWDVSPYAARPALISPDGCRLAAEGSIPGEWSAGLFVWDRCSG